MRTLPFIQMCRCIIVESGKGEIIAKKAWIFVGTASAISVARIFLVFGKGPMDDPQAEEKRAEAAFQTYITSWANMKFEEMYWRFSTAASKRHVTIEIE